MWNLKQKIQKLKNSAKQRQISVRLMDYEYENLLNLGCHYCGKNLENENGYCLDRIDSSKGYTLHNVVGCCKECNMAKGSMSFEQFVSWIERAYLFQQAMINKLKQIENLDYSYKLEKELHKHNKKQDSFCIKI